MKNRQIKLAFLGAAQNVTGSCFFLEANGTRLLIDCGLFQERALRNRNWGAFPIEPWTIDAVLLTHAHLDHCGLLPKLVKEGFNGKIYCTSATSEIAQIVLADSGKLQEEDAEFKRRRHERERRRGPYPEVPLYTVEDARLCFPYFSPIDYEKALVLGRGVEATFHDAGHVLGSAMIKLKLQLNGTERTMVFSGDVGHSDKPIVRDPTTFDEADYLVVESTYGDRTVESQEDVVNRLAEVVNSTTKARGNIVIPGFAVERSQEVLYYLHKLLMEDRIPHLVIFVDSPMAVSVTEVFNHHPEFFDDEMTELVRQHNSPFDFPGLKLVRTVDESKAINHIAGTVIIIAGSGMCTGGRIKHHLVANISRPESTVLFVGYQAADTLGRQIVDGASEVRILGAYYPVRARIEQINGFSAHADRDQLLRWVTSLKRAPQCVFVVHGEPAVSQHFAKLIRDKTGWEVSLPGYLDEVSLD